MIGWPCRTSTFVSCGPLCRNFEVLGRNLILSGSRGQKELGTAAPQYLWRLRGR